MYLLHKSHIGQMTDVPTMESNVSLTSVIRLFFVMRMIKIRSMVMGRYGCHDGRSNPPWKFQVLQYILCSQDDGVDDEHNGDVDDGDEDEDGDDDDVTAPQILLESFCLCNNCVMSGTVSAPGHFETKNYDGVSWCMVWHIVNLLVLDFADRHHMIAKIEKGSGG